MTFLELKTLVAGYMRRTDSDLNLEIGETINRVIRNILTEHDFLFLERTIEGTYTANAATMVATTLFSDTSLKTLKSLQLLANTGDDFGEALKFISYEELQRFAQRNTAAGGTSVALINSSYVAYTISDANQAYNLGLYPIPTSNVYLLAQVVDYLPELTADTDTNFFLTNFTEFLLFSCCFYLNYYLKSDERAKFTLEGLMALKEKVIAWDARLRLTTGPAL